MDARTPEPATEVSSVRWIGREDDALEKVASFAARHLAHHDAGSTDRVIDDLILAR